MSYHIVFNRDTDVIKAFDESNGTLKWTAQCRNVTVNDGFGHWGMCPPGEYKLDSPEIINPPEIPFGAWFIPLLDVNGLWKVAHRSAIGIHGGGSGLPDPFAAHQGWQITEGCFRLQNSDLTHLVTLVKGGERFTVT